MKTYLLWLACLLGLAVLLAGCGRPAVQALPPPSRLEQITQTGVMRVGVAVDVPPFAFIDRQGERQGFDVKLMSEIARRMGIEVTWVDMAYEPLRDAVRDGRLDVAIGAIPYSKEWDQQVDFTQPYYDLGEPGPADPGLLFMILPQGETALAERLNSIIEQLDRERFIQRLAEEYLAPRGSEAP